jgi:hypothetical protein
MQILCKPSDHAADVRCNICGQGFTLYWTRSHAEDRMTAAQIQAALHLHHDGSDSAAMHPPAAFSLSVAPAAGYFESLGAYA